MLYSSSNAQRRGLGIGGKPDYRKDIIQGYVDRANSAIGSGLQPRPLAVPQQQQRQPAPSFESDAEPMQSQGGVDPGRPDVDPSISAVSRGIKSGTILGMMAKPGLKSLGLPALGLLMGDKALSDIVGEDDADRVAAAYGEASKNKGFTGWTTPSERMAVEQAQRVASDWSNPISTATKRAVEAVKNAVARVSEGPTGVIGGQNTGPADVAAGGTPGAAHQGGWGDPGDIGKAGGGSGSGGNVGAGAGPGAGMGAH